MSLGKPLGDPLGNPLGLPRAVSGDSSGVGDIVTRLAPPPGSYLEADGRQLLKAMYPKLFSVIGDSYSVADFSSGVSTVTLPSSLARNCIAFGAGAFVALSPNSASIAISSDGGVNWSAGTLPVSASWSSIIFAGGQFIAISRGSAIAVTSPDGTTWVQRSLTGSDQWGTIAYGNGVYMAFADAGAVCSSSDGGVTWQAKTSLSTSGARYSAFGSGLFVVLTSGVGAAFTSADGVLWTSRSLTGSGTNPSWTGLAYGNGAFVAITAVNNVGGISTDGINWGPTVPPFASGASSISFGQGQFFVTLVPSSSPLWISSSGVTWFSTTLGVTQHAGIAVGLGAINILRLTASANIERYNLISPTNFNIPSLKAGDGKPAAYIKVA